MYYYFGTHFMSIHSFTCMSVPFLFKHGFRWRFRVASCHTNKNKQSPWISYIQHTFNSWALLDSSLSFSIFGLWSFGHLPEFDSSLLLKKHSFLLEFAFLFFIVSARNFQFLFFFSLSIFFFLKIGVHEIRNRKDR